jgi:hypothetical protein
MDCKMMPIFSRKMMNMTMRTTLTKKKMKKKMRKAVMMGKISLINKKN